MYLPSTCEDLMMIRQLLLSFFTFEKKNFYADVYVPTGLTGLKVPKHANFRAGFFWSKHNFWVKNWAQLRKNEFLKFLVNEN